MTMAMWRAQARLRPGCRASQGKGWPGYRASVSPCLNRSAGDIERADRGSRSCLWVASGAYERFGVATTATPAPTPRSATTCQPATSEGLHVRYPNAPRIHSANAPNPARYSAQSPVPAPASSTTPSCRLRAALWGQHSLSEVRT